MTRLLFLGVGVFGAGFSFLGISQVTVELPTLEPVWLSLSFALLTGLPLAIIACTPRAPLSVLRGLATLHVVVFSLALLTWPLAIDTALPFDADRPWILGHLIVATNFAAVLLPEVGAWTFIVISSIASGVLRVVAYGPPATLTAVEDAVFNAMVCSILVAITQVTLRAGRARDKAADATARTLASAAASEAKKVQRARGASLLHDDVISTLIVAGHWDPASEPLVRGYALRALGRLNGLRDSSRGTRVTTTAPELAATLRAVAETLATNVLVEAEVDDRQLPTAVGEAIIEATSEALRNSQRHATSDPSRVVSRLVVVRTRAAGLSVHVSDDGEGFDLRHIPTERFGIAVSIRRRMTLIGGRGEISTSPGHGTRVDLEWDAN